MDVWTLKLQVGGPALLRRRRQLGKSSSSAVAAGGLSSWWRVAGAEEDGFGLEIKVSMMGRRRCLEKKYRSLEFRVAGRKDDREDSSSSGSDPPVPEKNGTERENEAFDKTKSDGTKHSQKYSLSEWRDFRASLVALEQVKAADRSASSDDDASQDPCQQLGPRWAHPITAPEAGCVLVATEKLDGVPNFERTVVLLLRLGTRATSEGPFGVIINRPLHKKIKHMRPTNHELATTFADCSLHFGGPLDASMFLLKIGDEVKNSVFEPVVPGICFAAKNSLNAAAQLVKDGVLTPQDFRFFVGYAGWQLEQLTDEIESGYWIVAACSSHLIGGGESDSSLLWEEILQLMGGQYLELSRKPKQDGS